MNNQENQTFEYTYCAKEREEIKAIRQKYAAQEQPEDKLTALRRLDAQVTEKATVVSLVLGILGALIMGSGMSLAMTDIGEVFGLNAAPAMLVGIGVGVVGMVMAGMAYPAYNRMVKKQREKIAPEILRLTDELLQ
ncbi:MAG: hypothetical protein IJN53_02585 [Oscillospiraceae bacterium]|nr:hypothetical protein [Oscillospiraceae bacterium]